MNSKREEALIMNINCMSFDVVEWMFVRDIEPSKPKKKKKKKDQGLIYIHFRGSRFRSNELCLL